jgi:isopentenyldiphosphate isomerase
MVNNDELLHVVDQFDVSYKPLSRTETHANNYWHRTAHVWVVNDKSEILIQQRSLNKTESPGKWEPYVAGHINWLDDYFAGAVKEVREETGLFITKTDLSLFKIYQDYSSREFRGVFYLKHTPSMGEVIPEVDEVQQVKWIHIDQILDLKNNSSEYEWIWPGYEHEILPVLKV